MAYGGWYWCIYIYYYIQYNLRGKCASTSGPLYSHNNNNNICMHNCAQTASLRHPSRLVGESGLHNIMYIPWRHFCVCGLTLEIIIAERELWRAHTGRLLLLLFSNYTTRARLECTLREWGIEGGTTRVTTARRGLSFDFQVTSRVSRYIGSLFT